MIKNDNPWELGQEHITPDGTKLIVCQPERDGSGCMVCDGCWYLNNKKQYPCPNCRGPFVWIDSSWGVIFRTMEQVKKDSIDNLESKKPMNLEEELKKEIEKKYDQAKWGYVDGFGAVVMDKGQFIRIARHFAQWGAEHTPLPEDTVLFNKGVAEGKRLMMEDAVEGTITCHNLNRYILISGLDESLTYGDKVRLIIVKED